MLVLRGDLNRLLTAAELDGNFVHLQAAIDAIIAGGVGSGGGDVTVDDIAALQAQINAKAAKSVTDQHAADIDALQLQMADKISQAPFTSLQTAVNTTVTNVATLQTVVAGKADTTTVTALSNALDDKADAAAVNLALAAKVNIEDLAATVSTSTTNTFTEIQIFNKAIVEHVVDMDINWGIDVSAGALFKKTINAVTTFAVNNVPGGVVSFVLELTNGGAYSVTWFPGIKWPSGTAPTLTAAGMDRIGFYTSDAGATWQASVLALDSK